jgi:hypothetical protein
LGKGELWGDDPKSVPQAIQSVSVSKRYLGVLLSASDGREHADPFTAC